MQSPAREGSLRPRRTSAFRETGLFENQPQSFTRPTLKVRFRSKNDIFESPLQENEDLEWEHVQENDTEDIRYTTVAQMAPPRPMAALIHRLGLVAFILAVIITVTQLTPFAGNTRPLFGASGAPTTEPIIGHSVSKRADDPTDYCKRWSQQSAIVNGTLYSYGGRKLTSSTQKDNTWSKVFTDRGVRLSLTDLT